MSCSSSCHPTSIFLGSNKFQNGDILVLANPGPPGKCPLKCREEEFLWVRCCCSLAEYVDYGVMLMLLTVLFYTPFFHCLSS